jgi:hypothetical protein
LCKTLTNLECNELITLSSCASVTGVCTWIKVYFVCNNIINLNQNSSGENKNGAKCIKNSDANCELYLNDTQCKTSTDLTDSSKFITNLNLIFNFISFKLLLNNNNILRSCFWNVTNTGNNKCSTTKDKTISCCNLGNDVCSTEVGNIKNGECIWDSSSSLCVEYLSCIELDSNSCKTRSSSAIKDGPCTWIKVYFVYKKKKISLNLKNVY